METFQNVDNWLVSTDVDGVLAAACWTDDDAGCVAGLDDGCDDDGAGCLTSLCTDDCIGGCYDVTDCLNSPLHSKQWPVLCFNVISVFTTVWLYTSDSAGITVVTYW